MCESKLSTPNKKKHKLLKFFCICFFTLSFCTLIFYVTYFSIVNKPIKEYKANIKSCIAVINSINSDSKNLILDHSINEDKCKELLPESISTLKDMKSKINILQAPQNSADKYNNLLIGLEGNIKLYQQMFAIINNPKSNDLYESLQDFKVHKDTMIKSYFLVEDDLYAINKNEDTFEFINILISYTTNKIEKNNTQSLIKEKNSIFITKFDSALITLQQLLISSDLTNSISRIHEDNYDYSNILNEIKNLESSYITLHENFDKLVFPKEALSLHDNFSKILYKAKSHIDDLSGVVNSECNAVFEASSTDKIIEVRANYTDLYETLYENLKTFSTSLEVLNNDFISYRINFI
ncbi:MAG: hypothetical protein RSB70_05680 [Clostridium sp.]